MTPQLSFDQAPPISVPYRFFLIAPLFAVLAGIGLVWMGPDALSSRWTPSVLALAHLIAAGFMLQVMMGALLQFVPVAAGGNIPQPRLIAGLVQTPLAVGALALATAFYTQHPLWFQVAAPLLAGGGLVYCAAVGWALYRSPARSATLTALRIAIGALGVTIILGAAMAEALGAGWAWPIIELANIHMAWGLGGWALVLLAGVAFMVVPMFQLTRAYPDWFKSGFPAAFLGVLLVWSSQLFEPFASIGRLAGGGMAVLAGLFGLGTLWIQMHRRRQVTDPTFWLFRGGMVSLLLAVLLWGAGKFSTMVGTDPRMDVAVGILILVGLFVSVIQGMLYKIVPFLNWLHLQGQGATRVPFMNQMISERAIAWQAKVFGVAVLLLLAAVWLPPLARLAGGVFILSSVWLQWNLVSGVRCYLQVRGRIPAGG